jgi:hypothetical protein
MLDIEPGRGSRPHENYPDKLQRIINKLRKRYRHLNSQECRLMIIAEIEKMNLTQAERREILRRLRYKQPVHSV